MKKKYFEDVTRNMARCDLKIILGDFNPKVGREQYTYILKAKSKHTNSNGNGEKLIHFAAKNYMKIMSTSFDH